MAFQLADRALVLKRTVLFHGSFHELLKRQG